MSTGLSSDSSTNLLNISIHLYITIHFKKLTKSVIFIFGNVVGSNSRRNSLTDINNKNLMEYRNKLKGEERVPLTTLQFCQFCIPCRWPRVLVENRIPMKPCPMV